MTAAGAGSVAYARAGVLHNTVLEYLHQFKTCCRQMQTAHDFSHTPPCAPPPHPLWRSNLAVGGLWPGVPDGTTPFPATLTVDHVRVWGKPV